MDHPNDASNNNVLQSNIEKLFGISNLATTLSLQIREVATVIVGCIQELDPTITPTGGEADDFGIMGQMTPKELMHMANLEHTKAGLIASWKHVESEKQKVIQQAKTRIKGAGQ
jgi:hypothetical protein